MRFAAPSTVLALLLAGVCAAQGQQNWQRPEHEQQAGSQNYYGSSRSNRESRDARQRAATPESLTTDERLALLSALLDVRRRTTPHSDCTHFIHKLYERAGFPYEYANSIDLYEGIDEFRRVVAPQAGDLVVWRGHAGIVTNPARHTFFSLLRSGPEVDSYDSAYWRKRGRPRFFRYVKADSRGVRSTSLRGLNDH